jgi:hypothetical protein
VGGAYRGQELGMIIIRFVVNKVTQEIRLDELDKARIIYKALWNVSDVDEEGYPLAEMIGGKYNGRTN